MILLKDIKMKHSQIPQFNLCGSSDEYVYIGCGRTMYTGCGPEPRRVYIGCGRYVRDYCGHYSSCG